jgi:hypothetical protein
MLRTGESHQGMVPPQSPPLPVFIPVQAVSGADVPSQRLLPVAAIEPNHMAPVYGTPPARGVKGANVAKAVMLENYCERGVG